MRKPVKRGVAPSSPLLRAVQSPDRNLIGLAYPLDGQQQYQFGRSKDLPHTVRDHRMSRKHAALVPVDGGYVLEDLNSLNGTFLDGRPVHGRVPLDGQVISMGDTLFVVDDVPSRDDMPISPDADPTVARSIYGVSLASEALRAAVATVGDKPGPVLILGPTGVGKEVTARAVHEASQRRGPFIPINCAAVPESLAESQLFGYYKGAFFGADRDTPGVFQSAGGGTLFLDEVGELPLPLQAKLLRVLEDHVVQRLGHGPPEKVDVRIVAATNAMLEGDGFRSDLLARLSGWILRIPPLADRKADILELWRHFLEVENPGRVARPASADFLEALLLHDWPQNARELRKLAIRLDGTVPKDETFDLSDLPTDLQAPLRARPDGSEGVPPASTPTLGEAVPPAPVARPGPPVSLGEEDGEGAPTKDVIEVELRVERGNVKRVAEKNGWHRTSLYRWMDRYGLKANDYR